MNEQEVWALEPQMIDGNAALYSPGIKWGVSLVHTHVRSFCPVLGVMQAKDLYEAIDLKPDGFGLTLFESLDSREQRFGSNLSVLNCI